MGDTKVISEFSFTSSEKAFLNERHKNLLHKNDIHSRNNNPKEIKEEEKQISKQSQHEEDIETSSIDQDEIINESYHRYLFEINQ